MTAGRAQHVVCLATFFKGGAFLRECRGRGARVTLITREKLASAEWPYDALSDLITVPTGAHPDDYVRAVARAARSAPVTRVVALEEYDVVTAARAREHLCLPGLASTAARYFQDKLATRARARESGLPVPDFTGVFNPSEIDAFLARTEGPWMLKPRVGASAMGMKKLDAREEVWHALAALDSRAVEMERPEHHLVEQFIPGEVFHVDSLTANGRIVFSCAARYGRPPLSVAHGGGVSTSHTVKRGSAVERSLLALNRKVLAAFGFRDGTTHAEFIRADADGRLYLLEVAARVGGAHTAEEVEAATGVNVWREWARIETATEERPYELPAAARAGYGGVVISLAREEWPDTSDFDDPEIVFRVAKPWHVGLVIGSTDHGRVVSLLADYERRFAERFAASAPPEETPTQHL
jgi:biotin carboxylase